MVRIHPKTEKAYWQEITKTTLKRSGKNWKILIPVENEFNTRCAQKLKTLVNCSDYKIVANYSASLEDRTEQMTILNQSHDCLLEISELMGKIYNDGIALKEKAENTYTDVNKASASLKKYATDSSITAKKMHNSIELYSELFAIGFQGYSQLLNSDPFFKEIIPREVSQWEKTINGYIRLINNLTLLSKILSLRIFSQEQRLKIGISKLKIAIETIIQEITISKQMVKSFIEFHSPKNPL